MNRQGASGLALELVDAAVSQTAPAGTEDNAFGDYTDTLARLLTLRLVQADGKQPAVAVPATPALVSA